MKQITINPNNEPYYSEDFTKGFNCGAQRQFEADKSDADRPQGEWIYTNDPLRSDDEWECSRCGNISFMKTNFCDRCGCRMRKENE